MQLVVDLSNGDVELRRRHDMKQFSVRALPLSPDGGSTGPALDALSEALAAQRAGIVAADGDVLVPADAVRRLAGKPLSGEDPRVGPGWESELTAMIEYAATRGWVTDDGSLRVHVEWGC